MAKSGEKTCQRRAASRIRFASGKKKREPRALEDQTQNDVVLGWSLIFLKLEQPKTTSF